MMNAIELKDLQLMIESASNNLQNNKKLINDLNVFPVPDGDTGTNMSLTFGVAAADVLKKDIKTAGELTHALAKSALRNARGNSGVILSQILRGFSSRLRDVENITVSDLKNATMGGRDTAYRAVMKPTEGTILTVIREIAEFAEEHFVEYDDVSKFLEALLEAGQKSLANTPEYLPVLKQAGVVDAGGMGVVVLLEGMVKAFVSGKVVELTEDAASEKIAETSNAKESAEVNIKYHYCTEFLINKTPDRQAKQFIAAIESKGDCMLVIDDEEIVKVHIHTNHPGFVIEQALKLGELTRLKIDNMKYQHDEKLIENADENKIKTEDVKPYGFVAVSSGSGMSEIFKSVDVDIVVEGGQTMNPSTQDLLDAVGRVNAETVFILPNNKNIILAAEQVCGLAKCKVVVIPTRNIPEGISAVLGFDEGSSVEENIEVMNAMKNDVKCGQITFAARDSRMDNNDIHEGDIMGIVGSKIEFTGNNMNAVCHELTDSLVTDETGVISIYYG
ncbi:MAG: DAK2 domain-containing protein, partial [Oscillospiraceae bacterium]